MSSLTPVIQTSLIPVLTRQNSTRKQSPSQVDGFGGRSILKLNPERVVEILEQTFFVQNFTVHIMAQDRIFIFYRSGDIREKKAGQVGKHKIFPPTIHRFSRAAGRIKKRIVRTCSFCLLLLEYKRISFLFNHLASRMIHIKNEESKKKILEEFIFLVFLPTQIYIKI